MPMSNIGRKRGTIRAGIRERVRSSCWLAVCTLLILLPGVSTGYEIDSHYYLRFGLSLATCFNWDEAHLIASGDWGLDQNGSTTAEMNPVQTRNKVDWHAFGHSDRRFHELWQRSVTEQDLELRLIKLGQFMHFLEDWEAHAGYGIRMGHARDTFGGRDPDSLGNSFPKNHRMVQSALDHLLATCEDLDRLSVDRDIRLIEIMKTLYDDGFMDQLYEASNPAWKRGKLGGYRSQGPAIKSVNKQRVEKLIEDFFKPLPQKSVPADFAPGTERGIPASLAIPFDQDGNIVDNRSVKEALREWAAASDRAPDVALSLENARIYYRGSGQLQRSGWRLRISASNIGEIESAAGQIEIVVIDSDDETVLAQTFEPLPSLQPGETRVFQISLPASGRPEPDVMIASFARVGDLTAMNDWDWLMLGDAEEEEPAVPIITDLDPPPAGAETVHFLDPPRSFIVGDSVCMLITAYTSGGDSPEKLDQVVFEVIGSTVDSFYFERVIPSRWSAITSDDGLVAGKTFECSRPDLESYELLKTQDPESLRISVTLGAQGLDSHTKEFPTEAELVRAILKLAKNMHETME